MNQLSPIKDRCATWVGPIAVLLAVAALLYGQTLHVPFYLDDYGAIIDNYLLRDLPEIARRIFSQRGLSTLTLAVNYRLTGPALPPLHLVNIALHAGCGLLFWLLLRRLVAGSWLPLCGALLFIAHPLQTQAVTYLVQRATVLGAFFFLAAVLCYLKSRDALAAGHDRRSAAYQCWYLGALLAGAGAVLAKENTATLPLLLLACDRLFCTGPGRSRRQAVLDILPFCVVPLLLAIVTFSRLLGGGEAVSFYGDLSSLRYNSPLNYLFTQFQVVWVYLRLLVLPVGQALEYNYPVAAVLLNGKSLLGLAGLLGVGWLTWRGRIRQPLLVFGVVWFFLGLAVESSLIPLDPLFEHRLYLPMAGFVLVLVAALPALFGERPAVAVLAVAVLVCLPLTWQRNALWNDPIAFYEDNLAKVPDSERALLNLSVAYEKSYRFREERQMLERAVVAFPDNVKAYLSLSGVYREQGRHDRAAAVLEAGIARIPDRADLYEATAELAKERGDGARAVTQLQRGLAVSGIERASLFNDLGIIWSEQGERAAAEQAFRESIAANRKNPIAYRNLGKEYYEQRRWREAIDALRESLRLQPHHPETLEGMGRAAFEAGDAVTVHWALAKLKLVDPAGWQRLQRAVARKEPGR